MRWTKGRFVLLGAVLIFLAFTAFTSVAEIGPGEQAVIRRFGRVIEVRDEPGLYIGLPWGIDRVDRVAVDQIRRVVVGFAPEEDTAKIDTPVGQLLTGDQNLVNVQVVVNYSVDPSPSSIVDYVINERQIESVLGRVIEGVLMEWIGNRGVDRTLQRGKSDLPDELVKQTQERVKLYRLGIRLRSATVSTLAPPSQVKPAFDRVAQAQTEIRTLEYRARQQSDLEWSNFRAEQYRIESETETYIDRKLSLAIADGNVFELRRLEKEKNPQIVQMNRLEYRQKLLSRLRNAGQNNPLDPKFGENNPIEKGKVP